MQQYIDIDSAQVDGPTVLTIGNFDGMHRGHQALLQRLRSLAATLDQRQGALHHQTGLITFDPHPLAVLQPERPQALLTTPQERLALAADLGVDLGVIQTFTPEFARLEPRAFLQLLKNHLGMAALVVGPDFALGRNRTGDIVVLHQLGEELGYLLHVVEPITWHGETQVRSSAIRQALAQGDVQTAADMLGRPYTVAGTVVAGDGRGRQLGIPTANIQTAPEKLLPADGVYATWAQLPSSNGVETYASVTNLGTRPTIGGQERRLETHLLDFPAPGRSDDLYGQTVTLLLVARLRGEQRFPNLDALVTQIHTDIAEARAILGPVSPPTSV
ncbi:MAG: bifunctional riboflavin kinase/FMN adenylyltransferase [Chloroflexi bacterium]|nr:MAG: bifunctional riboflavin kinase/FMN adenylyltransferase [Chloroflexota bacterium]